MTTKKLIPYAAITFVMIIWGLSFLSIKVAVNILAPMTLALIRFLIASAILLVILKLREPDSRPAKEDLPRLIVSGIVGITLYFFFENHGIKLTTASTASIIVAVIPMLMVISDRIFCGTRLSWIKGVGVVLSFAGVFLVVGGSGQFSLTSKYFAGNMYMLGAAAAWVIYSLVTRPLVRRYSQLAITTYQTLFGTLAIIPMAAFDVNRWSLVDGPLIAHVLFLAVFCSALGYYTYVYAINQVGVDVAALFINLIPVVTVVSSYYFLGEKITPAQLLGGGLVIASVYLGEFINLLRNKGKRRAAEDGQGVSS